MCACFTVYLGPLSAAFILVHTWLYASKLSFCCPPFCCPCCNFFFPRAFLPTLHRQRGSAAPGFLEFVYVFKCVGPFFPRLVCSRLVFMGGRPCPNDLEPGRQTVQVLRYRPLAGLSVPRDPPPFALYVALYDALPCVYFVMRRRKSYGISVDRYDRCPVRILYPR